MDLWQKEMNQFKRETESYNREVLEYNKEATNHIQNLKKELDKNEDSKDTVDTKYPEREHKNK